MQFTAANKVVLFYPIPSFFPPTFVMAFLSALTVALAASPFYAAHAEKVFNTITAAPAAPTPTAYGDVAKRADPNQPLTDYFYPYSVIIALILYAERFLTIV